MRAWGAEDPESPVRYCHGSGGSVADEGKRARQRRASLPTEALQPARRVLLSEEMPRRQQRLTVANCRRSSQQHKPHHEGYTMPSGEGGVSETTAHSSPSGTIASHSVQCKTATAEANTSVRRWITQRATDWYLAPDIRSTKIGQMPAGREVSELPSARPQPGWCAIEPRGFVTFEDLAPTKCSKQEETDVAAHDMDRAKQELDDLLRAREAVARDLAELEDKRDEEVQRLQCYHLRRQAMKEKLSRCSDVVARTVDAVDRAHLLADDASIGGMAGAAVNAEILQRARVDVVAAGKAVTLQMQDIGVENEPPFDENMCGKGKLSKLSAQHAANMSRSPFQPLSCNVERSPMGNDRGSWSHNVMY